MAKNLITGYDLRDFEKRQSNNYTSYSYQRKSNNIPLYDEQNIEWDFE